MAAVTTPFDFEADQLVSIEVSSNEYLSSKLADDYSKYFSGNIGQKEKLLQDTIEEMLLRLDEFVTLIDMVRSDSNQCINRTLPAIYEKFSRLNEMKEKIDKLEAFVEIVSKNLDEMERKVVLAEQELRQESSIEKVFRPFFKKETSMQQSKHKKKPVYISPEIMKMSDYFHPNNPELDIDEDLDEACALSSNFV